MKNMDREKRKIHKIDTNHLLFILNMIYFKIVSVNINSLQIMDFYIIEMSFIMSNS